MLAEWIAIRHAINQIRSERVISKKIAKMSALAKPTKANILIVDFQIPDQQIAKMGKKMGSFRKFSVIQID